MVRARSFLRSVICLLGLGAAGCTVYAVGFAPNGGATVSLTGAQTESPRPPFAIIEPQSDDSIRLTILTPLEESDETGSTASLAACATLVDWVRPDVAGVEQSVDLVPARVGEIRTTVARGSPGNRSFEFSLARVDLQRLDSLHVATTEVGARAMVENCEPSGLSYDLLVEASRQELGVIGGVAAVMLILVGLGG